MKNILRINIAVLIISLLVPNESYSQENYQTGYVINQNGDTLKGLIDYRNWNKNPKKITFRSDITKESIFFSPLDLKKFYVADESYEGAVVTVDSISNRVDELTENSTFRFRTDTIFLQCIVDGAKSLYYYKDKNNKEHFFINQGSKFELLQYKKYIKRIGTANSIIENKKYIGQLTNYFSDCPTVPSEFKKVEYSQKSLEKLFLRYYECTKGEIKFRKKRDKVSIETGALIGVSMTKIQFSGSIFPYLGRTDYAPSVNPTAALFVNFILPRNQKKWSIANEIMYTTYSVTGHDYYYENANSEQTTDTKFKHSYLRLNNMVRFRYPTKNMLLFFNAGIINGFMISEENYKKAKDVYYGIETITEGEALPETRKHQQGFGLGIGASKSKYSLEFRYERDNGISSYSGLKSNCDRLSLMVGYKFK